MASESPSTTPVSENGTPKSTAAAAAQNVTNAPSTPLRVATSFIKQYYQVLSTTPGQIHRFYKPNTSVLSHSFLSSIPADPKILPAEDVDQSTSLFQWAMATESPESADSECNDTNATAALCFDLSKGSIDAQESVDEGILMVVTGHMKLPGKVEFESFVHTFFLNNGAAKGKRKQFYVHNDILRVIIAADDDDKKDVEVSGGMEAVTEEEVKDNVESSDAGAVENESANEKPVDSDSSTPRDDVAAVATAVPAVTESQPDTKKEEELLETPPQDKSASANEPETAKEEPKNGSSSRKKTNESKGDSKKKSSAGNKEDTNSESKKNASTASTTTPTSPSTDESAPTQPPKDDKKSKKNKNKSGRSRKDRGGSPTTTEKADSTTTSTSTKAKSSNKPKAPGSWAGIVASSTPPSPSRPSAAAATAAATAAHMTSGTVNPASVEESKEGMDMSGINPTPTSATTTPADKSSKPKETATQTTTKVTSGAGGPPPRTTTNTSTSTANNSSATNASATANTTTTPQRTPEATLFLKNIADKTKETDIRKIFEPYAVNLNQKILGITLQAGRGFCFVDFDSKNVVDVILKDVEALKEAHKNSNGSNGALGEGSKFMVHGKFLDVGRKVPADNKGGGRGGSSGRFRNRSGSPGNGAFHKPRGGGGHHRRNSPRGWNRGSGGGGGGGHQRNSNAGGGSSGGK